MDISEIERDNNSEAVFDGFSSTTESMPTEISQEFFNSVSELSSQPLLCMDSINECDEYFENQNTRNEENMRNSFSAILSSCNGSIMKCSSSRTESDCSSKRCKSSTHDQPSFIDYEEDSETNIVLQDMDHTNKQGISDTKDGSKVFSGFKTCKNKDILINKSHLEELFQMEQEKPVAIESANLESCTGFLNDLILSISSTSSNASEPVDPDDYLLKQIKDLPIGDIEISKDINNIENDVGTDQSRACNPQDNGNGVRVTANHPLYAKPSRYEHQHLFNKTNPSPIISNAYIDSGFKTGNNKKIFIDPLNADLMDANTFPFSQVTAWNPPTNGISPKHIDNPESKVHSHKDTDKDTIKGSVLPAKQSRNDKKMVEIFQNVLKTFKNEESGWIFEQFKWTWLHLYLNKAFESGDLESEIIDLMKIKLKNEYSILRRIVEFDDVPFKFMVLGVIAIGSDFIELYDGFYSLRFEIDKNIHSMLKLARCDLGSKLYVFGSDILLKEPRSIFDVRGTALKLHYNSVMVCNDGSKLGCAKKISFLNRISKLRTDGGIVSALIVRIKKIVEMKYLVTVENYRNKVDDIEKELEKIYEIAEKTGYSINPQDIAIKPFCKMVIEDDSCECMLTWWSPPELKANEAYKLVYLTPVQTGFGLHLSTNKKTYFEKL